MDPSHLRHPVHGVLLPQAEQSGREGRDELSSGLGAGNHLSIIIQETSLGLRCFPLLFERFPFH